MASAAIELGFAQDRSLESPFRAIPANELVGGAEGILLRLGHHVSNQ
jgi:hypothetical protein